MGLYPSTINDGTTDHTLQIRGQQPSDSSIATEYFEIGDAVRAVSDYKLPKGRSPIRRQSARLYFKAPTNASTGESEDIVVNIGVTRNKAHKDADVIKAINMAKALLPNNAAVTNFVSRVP